MNLRVQRGLVAAAGEVTNSPLRAQALRGAGSKPTEAFGVGGRSVDRLERVRKSHTSLFQSVIKTETQSFDMLKLNLHALIRVLY